MALTPLDMFHVQFKPAFRGYDKGQVDEFLTQAREALENALKEKADMQRKAESVQEEIDRLRGIESAMNEALTLAQKTAEEVKTNAHRQAQMILQEAEQARVRMMVEAQQEAEKCRAEIALLQATRDRFESELRSMLIGYTEWLDRRKPDEEARAEVA